MAIETLAEIEEDGTLRARAPASAPRGKRHVVIVIGDDESAGEVRTRRLPDLSDFRAKLEVRPYPGNSVVDMRNEGR